MSNTEIIQFSKKEFRHLAGEVAFAMGVLELVEPFDLGNTFNGNKVLRNAIDRLCDVCIEFQDKLEGNEKEE